MSDNSSGGIGIGSLIFLALLILKATGNIAMSWFWVISSIIWAPLLVTIVIFAIIGITAIIAIAFKNWR